MLCAHQVRLGAQMFVYDPATGRSRHLADLTEASGEKALKAIHCRIQVFAPDGRYQGQFGSCGSGPGQLLRAHGLDFSPDYKRLYIADVDNNRVSVFDSAGSFLFSFGQKGWRSGDFHDGSVYAAVESRHRHGVQVFRPVADSGPVSREWK